MRLRPLMNLVCTAVFAAAWLVGAPQASAAYPERTVRVIVGFPPGGGVDVVGRIVAAAIGERLRATVVVENMPGFSGNIAAQNVKRAAPDGYTLLMAPTTSYALSQATLGRSQVGYDLARDFKAAATVGALPLVVIVNKGLGVSNLSELVQKARASTGELTYGSSGNGSTEHVITELFLRAAGIRMLHVPYKGSSPAMVDLNSGQIQMFLATTPTAIANLAGGRLNAVGIASAQRLALVGDIPTLKEQGLADFEAASTYSLIAPAGTPDAVVATLNKAIAAAMDDPATRERLSRLGVNVNVLSGPASAQQLIDEAARWDEAVRSLKLNTD